MYTEQDLCRKQEFTFEELNSGQCKDEGNCPFDGGCPLRELNVEDFDDQDWLEHVVK